MSDFLQMKILNIVGTRPNFMKIAPIIKEMKKFPDKIQPVLLHTGQHYDAQMSQSFFNELEIPAPDIFLNIGSDTHAKQVAKIMMNFEEVCDAQKPDAILVVGDVNSTMACSIVAAKKDIKIIHIEAGIRSFDRTMPEEINRLITDSITDYLFPPSYDAVENLLKEGHKKENIFLVGNVMIDTLHLFQEKIQATEILEKLQLTPKNYVTLTLHRPSNIDDKTAFLNILAALEKIQEKITIVFPIHPRSKKMIESFGLKEKLASLKNLKLIEPLGYLEFGKLVSNSKFVLTDSGGIQEETTIYQIPCITIRENTERPITVWEGTNELAGNNATKIIQLAEKALNNEWKQGKIPEFWDGKASQRIVENLMKL